MKHTRLVVRLVGFIEAQAEGLAAAIMLALLIALGMGVFAFTTATRIGFP
jgi:hypothetical protein